MVNEPPTGVLFRSKLYTPQMRTRLEEKMPEFDWHLGDSDLYPDYYVRGKRADGLTVKIFPEDEPGEFYVGVYCYDMVPFPQDKEALAIAQQMHKELLPIVEGIRRA